MIRFAAIADVQYADADDKIGRHYRASYEKLLSAGGEFSRADAAFAMNFGDAYDHDWENALAIKEVLGVSAERGKVKWRHVLGNHDFSVPLDKKAEVYDVFNLKKPGYYDFSLVDRDDESNKWRVVVLNGNEISLYAAENDAEKRAAQKERAKRKLADGSEPHNYNGSVSATQLEWLDKKLQEAEKEGQNVLVCSHFPLYANSKTLNSPRTRLASLVNVGIYYSDLGVSTWNGREILEILDRRPCVKAYMAGHLHEGSYGERNNVAHITLRGIVETETTAYAYVELGKDALRVEGIGEQPSYNFKFVEEQNKP